MNTESSKNQKWFQSDGPISIRMTSAIYAQVEKLVSYPIAMFWTIKYA